MTKGLRYILLTIMLIAASQAAGQYIIDKVCVGSVRYYRVDGEAGSTYTWKLTDPFNNETTLSSTADTVAITWNMAPGLYRLSTVQHSVVTNCDGVLEIGDIEVYDLPLAFAGNTMTLCEPGPYQLVEATAANYDSLLWTTSGDGTFDNDTIVNPVYTPGPNDYLLGNVTLTITASGFGYTSACPPAVSSVTIYQSAEPVVVTATMTPVKCFGGNDGTATANPTGGTGTYIYQWDDPALQTTQTATGLYAGTYTVIVTDGHGCKDTASVTVTQPDQPLASTMTWTNATCFGYSDGSATITVTGGTTPYSYSWNTVPVQTTATASNLIAGNYIVIVTDSNDCILVDSVTITQPPSIASYAGIDALICETQSYALSDATAANYSTLSWATSGDGTFSDGTILNPVYFPGAGDIASGNVMLSLTAHGIVPCPDSTDQMVLSISRQAVVSAGPNDSICESEGSYAITGSQGSYYTSLLWTTSGTGTFNDQTILHPVYTPSAADIAAGDVVLTLSATSAPPCIGVVSSMTLHITLQLIAGAGPDDDICYDPYTITGAFASNYSLLKWSHNGSGTLNSTSIPNPTYTPGPTESGLITFTLRAYSLPPCTDSIIDQMTLRIWPRPGGTLSGNSAICENDTAIMILTFYGTPPISVTYTNGADTTTISNIMVSPYQITVNPPPGAWVYTLIAMNDAHCPAYPNQLLGSANVTVHPLPDVEFTWNLGSQNYEVEFHIDTTVTDLGEIGNMILWNFGDGTFGYEVNPTHIYPTYSTYDVTLSVTDTFGCSNSVTHQVLVPVMPNAFFSSTSPVCLGQTMCFTNLSSGPQFPDEWITTYIWSYGDGSPNDTVWFPDDPDRCHLYAATGTYAVTLKVIDNNGYYDSYTANVTVMPNPVADFNYSSTLCPDQAVYFTDASVTNGGGSIASWNWNFADPGSGLENTSTLADPVHIFTYGDSTYNVRLIIVNFENCSDTMIQPVYIHPKPPVDFTFGTACLDQPVTFEADTMVLQLDSIVGWSWDFGDGTPPVGDPISTTHSYNAAGAYQVKLTVTDVHGCMNTKIHMIEVNPLPVAEFTWSSPVCQDSPVQFTDHSHVSNIFGGYIAKWEWNFGDGTVQTIVLPASPNVSHVFVGPALTHTVRLTVWTNDSCSSFVEHTINSIPKPVADFDHSAVACSGQPVQFTDMTQPNGGGNIASWSWDFGDPASGANNFSNLQNPSHTFAVSGTYLVNLIVVNVNNCSDTVIKPVTINVGPVADFMADTACLGTPTSFTDLSMPNAPSIISWSWNFGDGSPVNTQQNPAHTYANYGVYSVTLTVTNSNGCIGIVSKQVLVNPLPTAEFYFTSATCQGAPVCFTDMSTTPPAYLGQIVKWVWDYGDGTSQTVWFPANPDVCHTYAGTSSSYTVRLTVTTSDSCINFTEHTVTLLSSPVADFGFSNASCANQPVQFTDLSQQNGGGPITSWSWNFGDPASGANNNSSQQNPVHSFGTSGTYIVTLIVGNISNCFDTVVKSVAIDLSPVADFMADTACAGSPTTFTDMSLANAAGLISWSWNFGDGSPASTLQNPVYIYSAYGVYTVTLTVTNSNGCTDDISKQVMVNPVPVAEFSFPSNTCLGTQVCFTDLSTVPSGYNGYIVRWEWNFGDGTPPEVILFPANPNVCHTFAGNALSHVVRLTVTTSDNCSHFVEHTVSSSPAPVAGFTFTSSACEGETVQFTDQSLPGGGITITSWNWNFGDPASGTNNTSNLQNPSHSFTSSGAFTVTLIVVNQNLCSDTIMHTVNVNVLPVADFHADTACFGSPTHFTDLSVANAPGVLTYSWNFGDGTPVSTLQNPAHTYTSYGVYNVTLTIVNSNGCTKDTTHSVLVRPLPVPEFIFTVPSCQGSPVYYTDQSTVVPGYFDPILTWTWEFGDGSSPLTINYPASPNCSHIFAGTAVVHTVRLTVITLSGCNTYIEHVVTSNPAPVADFTYPATNCAVQSVQFTDMSQMNGGGPIVTWNWNFGDPASGANNTSGLQNPVHVFTAPGTFTVTLITYNSSTCSDTIQKQVTLSALPFASFTADTACLGSVTAFTDQSTVPAGSGNIASRFWEFGDGGTSTQANPTHLYANAGIYNVKLTVTTTHGCVSDTTIQVLVNTPPDATFSISGSTCAGDSVDFTDLSTTLSGYIVRWKWEFGDGQSVIINYPASPDVSHAYSNAGNFNVTLTVTTSDSCSDHKTLPVTIYPKPAANFQYSAVNCQFLPVQFTDISQGTGGSPVVSWFWDFGDPASGTGNTSAQQNPAHTYFSAGTYNVLLIVTNLNGCTDSVVKSLNINAAPVAQFTADTACTGSPTQFTDGSLPGSGTLVAWQWDFGDPGSGTNNTSTQQNPTHIYNAAGTYFVTLQVTNSNSCVNDTVIPVHVSPAPEAMFSYEEACLGDSTQFTDLSTAPGSQLAGWLWDFGDGGTSTQQNPKHAYANPGTYDVKLTVTNLSGCSDSIVQQVDVRPKPIADFDYVSFFCPAGKVNFQDKSQGTGGGIAERLWIFEPGYTSSSPNPTHTFGKTDTTYLVTLIVTDTFGCQDTLTESVFVKPGFEFTFTWDTVCFGMTTHFNPLNLAQGDSLYGVTWDFGDPASGENNYSNLYSPTHVFTHAGSFVVTMNARNSDNCEDEVHRLVIINDAPQVSFNASALPCDNVVHFNDESLPGGGTITQWIWNFGDGTDSLFINEPGPGDTSHIYATPGEYTVTLKVKNSSGCFGIFSQQVESAPCLSASFTQESLLCTRSLVTFSDNSLPVPGITSWHWYWGDGSDTAYTTYASQVKHSFAGPGNYTVKLVIEATIGTVHYTDSAAQSVVVRPNPSVRFSNPAVCLNKTTLFRDSSETFGAETVSWNWNFGEPSSGASNTSNVQDPSHKYSAEGIYPVKLVIANQYGCMDSLTKMTFVHGIPVAGFLNSIACESNPTWFYDDTQLANAPVSYWIWNFGDSLSIGNNSTMKDPVHKYKKAGNYLVKIFVADLNGCNDSYDSVIVVHPSPLSLFTVSEDMNGKPGRIQLINQSQGATTYQWEFGDGTSSTEENPVTTYTKDGTYIIELVSTNEYGCTDTSSYKLDMLFKGLWVPNAFSPTNANPAVRIFKPVGRNLKQYQIQVYDIGGHLMWESDRLDAEGRPMDGWDGMYKGTMMPQATYMWIIRASFIDGSIWEGSDIGKGEYKNIGTVSLIR